jgi:hypothetical protein
MMTTTAPYAADLDAYHAARQTKLRKPRVFRTRAAHIELAAIIRPLLRSQWTTTHAFCRLLELAGRDRPTHAQTLGALRHLRATGLAQSSSHGWRRPRAQHQPFLFSTPTTQGQLEL